MKFSFKNRVVINQFFPQRGNVLQQTVVRDLTEKLKVTQEEITEVNLKVLDNGVINWSPEKAMDKEIELTPLELSFLKEQVERLDKENNINQDIVDLVIKIKET